MIPTEIIHQKKLGKSLDTKELRKFLDAYHEGDVTDYQMSAFLMAVCLNGMNFEETYTLMDTMLQSGNKLAWPELEEGAVGDKHSTGGIGDKTSFLILPMCISEGVKMPMMAGRGLGHTGGTIDKIESLSGVQTRVGEHTAKKWMQEIGGMLLGQSTEIAPLDYRLYHLRDVTATVESIPLITASILSKKIAEGLKHLVMDVKTGSGAFLAKTSEAQEFAKIAKEVGLRAGLNVSCAITNMDEPLGRNAGNAVELAEVLELLEGNIGFAPDTYELSLELSAKLVQMCKPDRNLDEIKQTIRTKTDSGEHLECFRKLFANQGVSLVELDQLKEKLSKLKQKPLIAQSSGFIESWNTRSLGLAILALGGGRKKADESIDHWVGLTEIKKVGEEVHKGETLCMVSYRDDATLGDAMKILSTSCSLSSAKQSPKPLIHEWI